MSRWAWRNLVDNGRIRTRGINFPRRERHLARVALSRIGYKYRELVPFLNPLYKGRRGDQEETMQWLDFVVFHKRIYVLLFGQFKRGFKQPYEKTAWTNKLALLEQKGIPYAVLQRHWSSQEFEIIIRRLIKKG